MYRGKNYLTKTSEGLEINSKLYLETLEKLPYNNEDELEEDGYTYASGDNTYNYEDNIRCDHSMRWRLYIKKNEHKKGYSYAVAVSLHQFGDIRINYELEGIYKTNDNCFYWMARLLKDFRTGREKNFHYDKIDKIKKELMEDRLDRKNKR